MKHQEPVRSDVIDMGAASEETKGAWGIFADEVHMQEKPGLSID